MQDIFSVNSPIFVLIMMGVIFYFLFFRPQQQQAKQHRQAIENLRRGDVVVTSGGIVGKVAKAPSKEDPEITLEIADSVQIKVVKSTLAEVRAKTQPVDAKSDKG
jgi:preprotein translocase subunit YajC